MRWRGNLRFRDYHGSAAGHYYRPRVVAFRRPRAPELWVKRFGLATGFSSFVFDLEYMFYFPVNLEAHQLAGWPFARVVRLALLAE